MYTDTLPLCSSPSRSPVVVDNEIVLMNTLYKERFPKATQQMEERLGHFLTEHLTVDSELLGDVGSPIIRFVHHQVLEMARDCLNKSHAKLITSRYFYEMSENLERLLLETREKSPESAILLSGVIKKLLLIISRPARLLECLEFDPEEFYHLLEVAEGEAKYLQGITADLPQYIIHKLGLNRDPIAELQQELQQTVSSSLALIEQKEQEQEEVPLPHDLRDVVGPGNRSQSLDGGRPASPPVECGPNESFDGAKTGMLTSTPTKQRVKRTAPSEDDYDVAKLISNGAYGAVYLVKHRQTRQRFAMKKINKNNLILRNQVEQVFAERDILSFADNPFVVSMHCSFETRKHLCLVMEYVEGGDCATLLKSLGPLPSDMARFYFAETVLAVEYLHSYGIVHRDLKPDNLLITALGHIKLTDFGLSKMGLMSLATNLYEGYIDSETRQFSDKQVFGTPEYIAPEVILRQGYGKPVDWWSMGIVLYEFLVGCVPFFGETPEELFAHTVNDDIDWPSDDDWFVAPEAKSLIAQLLQQNPRDRLGTAGGAAEVKEHGYFALLDWNSLLRLKAEFLPQLENEDDTSYFDTRMERYNHELGDEDTDDMDDTPLFGSFNSYSPAYRKSYAGTPSVRQLVQPLVQLERKMRERDGPTESQSKLEDHASSSCSTTVRIPSTPNTEYFPDLFTSSDHEQSSSKSLNHFLRLQESSSSSCSFKSDVTDQSAVVKNLSVTHSDVRKSPLLQQQRKLKNTPESSQTDSDDVSPQIQRKRKTGNGRESIPRFSISIEDDRDTDPQPLPLPTTPVASNAPCPDVLRRKDGSFEVADVLSKHRSRALVKSASDLGLSLLMRSDQPHGHMTAQSPIGAKPLAAALAHVAVSSTAGSSSPASSRDTSPCRDLSPLVTNLKPPIVIRRGPRGFGFTVHTVRVFYGDTDFYTMHHLVAAVEEHSPAFEAGLRPADLITHVNGEPVQGLYHTQVLQLLLSCSEHVMIRATPLTNTSIQSGGRKRDLGQSRMAKRSVAARYRKKKDTEKKQRKTSLFRRISNKRANAEIQQLTAAGLTTPTNAPLSFGSGGSRLNFVPFDSASSQSSSANSSVPNTPTSSGSVAPLGGAGLPLATSASSSHLYQRPSSLHGLKHKLHSGSKGLHVANTPTTPNRRKSVAHIPLSPLARTPSPTRSPSPLTFPTGHHPGSSNTTQSYSPTVQGANNSGGSGLVGLASLNVSGSGPLVMTGSAIVTPSLAGVNNNPSNCIVTRRSFTRPKSTQEHGNNNNTSSPLLRRALSPDRRASGEEQRKYTSVSPLCGPPSTSGTTVPVLCNSSGVQGFVPISSGVGTESTGEGMSQTSSGDLLPRIAEEKDSPTSGSVVHEILKELKGVKVEPVAGDVKDKIRRFSLGAHLEQRFETATRTGRTQEDKDPNINQPTHSSSDGSGKKKLA